MRNYLLVTLLKLIALLPLVVVRWLGALIGICAWQLNSRESKVVRVNLQHCYPQLDEQELQQLSRESMRQWGQSLLEIPQVWSRNPQWSKNKMLYVKNEHLITEAIDHDQGVIVIAPHLGNWEVAGLSVAEYGPLTCLFSPTGAKQLDEWVMSSRARVGTQLAPANNRGVVTLLKALKAKQLLGILPDQVPLEGSGEFAPFFDRPALTMTLIHSLLQRTDAKAVYCYAKREKRGYGLIFESVPDKLYSDDSLESLTALNEGIERLIAGAVTQYQWEYKRFKKRLAGTSKLYTKENTK